MIKTEISDKINEILIEEFEIDGDLISDEKNVKETLDLDSLDYVDLVVIIESNFGVKLVKDDFLKMITFRDFYNIIQQKLDEKSA
ncbi:acyl carrier protein [Vaginella massiliensis]|uniref:acyl carrier protein n=1 Tax=Vaginella massiliensis TaxID=1816680 RepID=UPI000839AE87|nr:phosphopantetheine-binding protein [Vaginella massiliensis]